MATLEEAIRAFPVVSWMQDRVKIRDTGRTDIYCDCPFCKGKMKLGINREYKLFHCFKCDKDGASGEWNGKANLIQFIKLVTGGSSRDAIELIYKLAGYPDPPPPKRAAEQSTFPREAIPLKDCPLHEAYKYLAEERGVEHLCKDSYVCVEGRYAGRILMPCRWFDKIVGFEAKSFTKQEPKSLFPPEFDTSLTLYTTAWDFKLPFAIVTESIVDAETISCNTLGLYGSTLKDGQLTKLLALKAMGVERLIWMLDADAIKKTMAAILKKTSMSFENRVCVLEKDQDPNSMKIDLCLEKAQRAVVVRDEIDVYSLLLKTGNL